MKHGPYIHPSYGPCVSHHRSSMPLIFEELAGYYARRSMGVLHAPDYRRRMERLQADFDQWSAEVAESNEKHGSLKQDAVGLSLIGVLCLLLIFIVVGTAISFLTYT